MAHGSQVVLTAAAAAVAITDQEGHINARTVVVDNSGANPAQLGGAGVTATGYTLAAGASRTIQLSDRDVLYAFSTLGTTLQVLTSP